MKNDCIIALLMIIFLSCEQQQAPADPDVYYTCSMDPQVVEYQPGTCPICKMDLTPVRKSQNAHPDELSLSEQQITLGNIKTAAPGKGGIHDKLVLTATIQADKSKINAVSARVAGRIERLWVKNTGDYVSKGAPLYDLYSEVLYNAKLEYAQLIEKNNQSAQQADLPRLLEAAKNKLLLWGLTEKQIAELASQKNIPPVSRFYSPYSGYLTQLMLREGAYVMEGGLVLELTDLSEVWLEAQVYSSQLAQIDLGAKAVASFPGMEALNTPVSINLVYPELEPGSRINLLRATLSNPNGRLRPGSPAYLTLISTGTQALTLPVQAVLRGKNEARIWVKKDHNLFKMRKVITGIENGEQIEILSGLTPDEEIVVSGAYLLNSEFVFKRSN